MSFYDELKKFDRSEIEDAFQSCDESDVKRALAAQNPDLNDLLSLLSPAAEPFLEEMAQHAHRLTAQRFGKVISLFTPIYLSNFCTNSCAYCGFNCRNNIERLTLTPEQALAEGKFIRDLGFRHVLLLTGEAPKIASMDYFRRVLEKLRPIFPSISVEIYPMSTENYQELISNGVDGLTIFQETYHEEIYSQVHLGGKKRDFRWRLEGPDRGGAAGFRRIGLGALLGLADWRTEAFFVALHAQYLMRTYWRTQVSISFPRLRPASGSFQPLYTISDADLVQILAALRLFLPDAGFTLSTRETPSLRDHLIPLGITQMSAGSRTDPGGYTMGGNAEAQFEVSDSRSPSEVIEVIRQKGYEPVWKDWDYVFRN